MSWLRSLEIHPHTQARYLDRYNVTPLLLEPCPSGKQTRYAVVNRKLRLAVILTDTIA